MGVRFSVTEKTARLFMHKVREAMKSSENHPINGRVQVDEFVLGGKEEGKVGRSYDSKKKEGECNLNSVCFFFRFKNNLIFFYL